MHTRFTIKAVKRAENIKSIESDFKTRLLQITWHLQQSFLLLSSGPGS